MRNKLFVIILVVACLIVILVFAQNKETWIIAVFTVLVAYFTGRLAEVTKEYTEVTKKLLEQSEMASKQSRIAFLISVVDGLTEYVNQSTSKIGMEAIVSHCVGKLVAIGKIDKKIAEELWQVMKDWGSNTKYEEFANKYEESFRKKLS